MRSPGCARVPLPPSRLRVLVAAVALLMSMAAETPRAAPPAPSSLTASVSGSTVVLGWTPVPGVQGYRLEAGTTPGASDAATLMLGPAGGYTAAGVPPGTYYVRVRAVDASGAGAPSNEVTVTVGGATGCPAPPGPPVVQSATAAGMLVSLAWAPSPGCPPASYVLQAGASPGASDIAVANLGAQLSFSASAPAGVYYLRLVAVNAFGVSAPSQEYRLSLGAASSPGGGIDVDLASSTISTGPGGETVLLGIVTNRSADAAAVTRVTATLTTTAGAVSASGLVRGFSRRVGSSGTLSDSTLAPGETGCFHLTVGVPRASVLQAGLTVDVVRDTVAPLLGRAEVVGVPAVSAVNGRVHVAGEVRNTGSLTVYNTRAVALVLRDGLVVGCDRQLVSGSTVVVGGVPTNTALLPGETRPFGFTTPAPAPALATTVWMQWDEGP